MISLIEADQLIQTRVHSLATEKRPLNALKGCVLAENISADRDHPPWNQSAMDGFAVFSGDLTGTSLKDPVELRINGEVAAGDTPNLPVKSGEGVRIMTGAPVPEGADSVVPVEKTRDAGNRVLVLYPVSPGENIRPRGEDYTRGQVVLKKGTKLNSSSIGLLAAVGRTGALVVRSPRVAILATGNELVEPGEPDGREKIRNSNSYALEAQVKGAGGIPDLMGIAPDSPEGIRNLLERSGDSDMILVSGGVSVGAYDYVKGVLEEMGADRVFWRVAIKPGGPLAFWMLGEKPVFGLPGNPVSAMVCFEEFVGPAIRRMAGHRILGRPMIRAVLKEDFQKEPGKTIFARAIIHREDDKFIAQPLVNQSSGALSALSRANGLIVIPSESGPLKAGTPVSVRLLEDGAWWIYPDEGGENKFWIRDRLS